MNIRDIAIKHLLRRKAKAGFVLTGLIVGVATVIAVVSYVAVMTGDITEKLEKYGANILIVPRTDDLTLSYGGITLGGVSLEVQEIDQAELAKLRTIPNAASVAAVGPVVLGGVQIKERRVMLAGVDFPAAAILKPWWRVAGTMPEAGQVLLGAEAARVLDAAHGRTITIAGRSFPVTGVLQSTGSQDDHLIFTDIPTAQGILGKPGSVSLVEVAALCNACPITDMVRQISEALPMTRVKAIQQVVAGRMQTLNQFRTFAVGISIVVVVIGGLVVLVTLMGSVRERRQEIGIFRAIGFRETHVMQIIFTETALVSLAAGVFGYLIGTMAVWGGLQILGKGYGKWPEFDPVLASGAIAMAFLVGVAASIYPAVMASRLDPNDALKTL